VGSHVARQLYDATTAASPDVTYAVAETGSLVIRTNAEPRPGLSLVPMFHVAVIEPKQILPDLVDLFTRLAEEGTGNHVMMISGPSKTADIEMNVVTGVHGPNVVKAFVLRSMASAMACDSHARGAAANDNRERASIIRQRKSACRGKRSAAPTCVSTRTIGETPMPRVISR
jgi:hypothetical protein